MNNKSVTRRAIAIMFSICGAGVLSFLAIRGDREALVALISIVCSVIGFYFAIKTTQI